jgi:translation initiation factor IF-3
MNLKINNEIESHTIRLIDDNGEQLGVMPTKNALNLAYNKNLDLVLINEKAVPPVAKILNYEKHKYQEDKRQKELKKIEKSKRIDTKEICFRSMTDTHDLQIKANKTIELLSENNNVRLIVKVKGRELMSNAEKTINTFLSMIDSYKVVYPINKGSNNIMITIGKL